MQDVDNGFRQSKDLQFVQRELEAVTAMLPGFEDFLMQQKRPDNLVSLRSLKGLFELPEPSEKDKYLQASKTVAVYIEFQWDQQQYSDNLLRLVNVGIKDSYEKMIPAYAYIDFTYYLLKNPNPYFPHRKSLKSTAHSPLDLRSLYPEGITFKIRRKIEKPPAESSGPLSLTIRTFGKKYGENVWGELVQFIQLCATYNDQRARRKFSTEELISMFQRITNGETDTKIKRSFEPGISDDTYKRIRSEALVAIAEYLSQDEFLQFQQEIPGVSPEELQAISTSKRSESHYPSQTTIETAQIVRRLPEIIINNPRLLRMVREQPYLGRFIRHLADGEDIGDILRRYGVPEIVDVNQARLDIQHIVQGNPNFEYLHKIARFIGISPLLDEQKLPTEAVHPIGEFISRVAYEVFGDAESGKYTPIRRFLRTMCYIDAADALQDLLIHHPYSDKTNEQVAAYYYDHRMKLPDIFMDSLFAKNQKVFLSLIVEAEEKLFPDPSEEGERNTTAVNARSMATRVIHNGILAIELGLLFDWNYLLQARDFTFFHELANAVAIWPQKLEDDGVVAEPKSTLAIQPDEPIVVVAEQPEERPLKVPINRKTFIELENLLKSDTNRNHFEQDALLAQKVVFFTLARILQRKSFHTTSFGALFAGLKNEKLYESAVSYEDIEFTYLEINALLPVLKIGSEFLSAETLDGSINILNHTNWRADLRFYIEDLTKTQEDSDKGLSAILKNAHLPITEENKKSLHLLLQLLGFNPYPDWKP